MRSLRPRSHARRSTWSGCRVLAGALALAATAGCGDVLDVTLPGEIQQEALDDPTNADALVTSLVGAFECAYTNYVLLSANVGDELMVAGSFSNFFPYDQRDVTPDYVDYAESDCENEGGLYTPLSMARWLADEAFRRIEAFPEADVPNKTTLLATAAVYAGYSYTLFGEGFCRAAFDLSEPLDPPEVLTLAEERFTQALQLAQSSGDDDIVHLARLGRARVRLGLGRSEDAAEDARAVPAGFAKLAPRSEVAASRENKIYVLNHLEGRTSVEPGFWNLEWKGTPDPRVAVTDAGRKGNDSLTPLWLQTRYTSRSTAIPLATYNEARLILAEAVGGQTAVDIINELHVEAGLPPFDDATDGDVIQHLIQERSRELFLTGHRLGDLLRFDLPFPSGAQPWTGRPYRQTTCFPLPNVEINNNPGIPS